MPSLRNKNNDSVLKTFGANLKQVRLDNKMNQRQFANELGITQATLSALELGDRNPKLSLINDICRKYKVSANKLLGIKFEDIKITFGDCFKILFYLLQKYPDLLEIEYSQLPEIFNPKFFKSLSNEDRVSFIEHDLPIFPYLPKRCSYTKDLSRYQHIENTKDLKTASSIKINSLWLKGWLADVSKDTIISSERELYNFKQTTSNTRHSFEQINTNINDLNKIENEYIAALKTDPKIKKDVQQSLDIFDQYGEGEMFVRLFSGLADNDSYETAENRVLVNLALSHSAGAFPDGTNSRFSGGYNPNYLIYELGKVIDKLSQVQCDNESESLSVSSSLMQLKLIKQNLENGIPIASAINFAMVYTFLLNVWDYIYNCHSAYRILMEMAKLQNQDSYPSPTQEIRDQIEEVLNTAAKSWGESQ